MNAARKIRVLEMIDEASLGGGQVHVLMLAKYLDRTQFEIAVACEGEGYLVAELRKLDVPVVPVAMSNKIRFGTLSEIKSKLQQTEYDILHTHGGTAGFWGRLGSLRAGKPSIRIHTYHGIHYLNHFNLQLPLYHLADKYLSRLTDKIVCVCKSDLRKALNVGIATSEKSVVIYNGIEISKFRTLKQGSAIRRSVGANEGTIVFGNVGRLHLQKGQTYLLEAFRTVRAVHREAHLWIVGDGEVRLALERLAEQLRIHDAVHFWGTRTDLPDLLSAMDVFVLSSLWEGQPISLLEAVAAGKPVISTQVDGVSEILTHEVNGLLVPPKEPTALAAAMTRMIEDAALRRRLSDAALLPVHFSAQEMASQIGHLYSQIYSRRPAREASSQ